MKKIIFTLYLLSLFTSCSTTTKVKKISLSDKGYRSLANIDSIEPSCQKLVAQIINFDEEVKVSKKYKNMVEKFWKRNVKHNVDDLSWFGKYELWSSNILQSWNKNPQPIFFIEDPDKSFYAISSFKRYFKKSESAITEKIDVIEYPEAKEIVDGWLTRYSNFKRDINFLQKKIITLKYQSKKIKKLRWRGKYPFSIKITVFKDGETKQVVKIFKNSGNVKEYLTELKIQRYEIQTPITKSGLLKKVQFRQASDYERLKRLHRALENIYLTQLEKDAATVNLELKEALVKIESILSKKYLKPHRSFRRKFITQQKTLEWEQFREFLISLRENEKIVKIKEFLDSFSDEQIKILGLTEKKERWDKSKNIVNRNRWYIGATSALTASGGGVGAYIQYKDLLFAETEQKQKCIRKDSDAVAEFVACVNTYILENLELKHAMTYVNNGYKGLNKALDNNEDQVDKFIALTNYFISERKEYLSEVKQREIIEKEEERVAKQEILDRLNPRQDNNIDDVNDGVENDGIDSEEDTSLESGSDDLSDLGDVDLLGDEFGLEGIK